MTLLRSLRAAGSAFALLALLLLNPSVAHAATASGVSPSLTFSGSGSTQTVVTKVTFTSTYSGAYYVKYDIYRSLSSTKSSSSKVTSSSITQTFATTTKGSTYTTTVTSKSCPANSTGTTYYYWLVGSVTDGGSGVVSINSSPVARVACTSVY